MPSPRIRRPPESWIEGSRLLGEPERIAHGENRDGCADFDGVGGGRAERQHGHHFVEIGRRTGKQVAHVVLRRKVIVAPSRVIAEPFAGDGQAHEVLGRHERHGVH